MKHLKRANMPLHIIQNMIAVAAAVKKAPNLDPILKDGVVKRISLDGNLPDFIEDRTVGAVEHMCIVFRQEDRLFIMAPEIRTTPIQNIVNMV